VTTAIVVARHVRHQVFRRRVHCRRARLSRRHCGGCPRVHCPQGARPSALVLEVVKGAESRVGRARVGRACLHRARLHRARLHRAAAPSAPAPRHRARVHQACVTERAWPGPRELVGRGSTQERVLWTGSLRPQRALRHSEHVQREKRACWSACACCILVLWHTRARCQLSVCAVSGLCDGA
jgi:hypothetical protein